MLNALSPPKKKSAGPSSEARQVEALEKELDRKERALAELAALLALKKKSPGDLGGRGRRHEHVDRDRILGLIDEAVAAGAR